MIWIIGLYVCLVAALLASELCENSGLQRIFKPLAALGFIGLALYVGALNSLYGQIIFVGLLACALGDVFLLSRKSQGLFLAGMGAFALGHFAYLTAFVTRQTDVILTGHIVISMIAIGGGVGFYSWLKPKLPKGMAIPVGIYTGIIILMVIRSFGLPMSGALMLAPIGAVLFAVSDMFVARDRFVAPTPKNALAITPLYFGAQALFALSTQV